jgi:SET domain-containing protein
MMDSVSNLSVDLAGTTEGLLKFERSPIHGLGAFATTMIAAGTPIIEYTGERITKDESLRRCQQSNEYIFCLDERWDLDGNAGWNPAKFINHSCDPNSCAELSESRIWIVSIRPIQPGEEITFNYGYDLQDFREHPCRCGAANCVGYILAEEFFPSLPQRKV